MSLNGNTTAAVDPAHAWEAVVNHDRRFDGRFVYGVASTGIYCRPSCPSRRPARHRVTFFHSTSAAEGAGFRACRRCQPQSVDGTETEQRIEAARRYLDAHADKPLSLQQLASQTGLSPSHLQRTFARLVGLSPKAYQDAQRMARFTAALKRGETVTHATYEAGFGSSSRVYERSNAVLGMTPLAFRVGGKGVTLRYASVPTALGRLLVAATERGLAAISLGDTEAELVAALQSDFPKARVRRDRTGLHRVVQAVVKCLTEGGALKGIPLDIAATGFQQTVWRALQQIPRGETRTYREIAIMIGRPTASRAVGRACATNPLAIAIPCHRAVRGDGHLAGYRWGLQRKRHLLEFERPQS